MKKNSKLRYMFYIFSLIVLISVDQLVKFLIVHNLNHTKLTKFIPNVISLEYLENRGVAFGIFSGRLGFITILVIVIVCVILYISYKLEKSITKYPALTKKCTILQFICIFLVAGAIGNLIDRIRLGYVIDYIKVEFISFPIFNIADCYVTLAAAFLFIYMMFFIKEDEINKIFSDGKK